jgi:hypothetical protein
MFIAMYQPVAWPILSNLLNSAIDGQPEVLLGIIQGNVDVDKNIPPVTAYALAAILCADAVPFEGDKLKTVHQGIEQDVFVSSEVTPHFTSLLKFGCHNWPSKQPERFSGPFNSTLANRILVIGNTADVGL